MIVDEYLSCSNLGTLCEGVLKDKSSFKSYRMAGGFGAATLSPWSLHWLRRAVAALVHPRPLVTTRPVSQHKISDTISQGNFGASMCQDVVNLACDQVIARHSIVKREVVVLGIFDDLSKMKSQITISTMSSSVQTTLHPFTWVSLLICPPLRGVLFSKSSISSDLVANYSTSRVAPNP